MSTRKILTILQTEEMNEIKVEKSNEFICFNSSDNDYPIFMQISIEDWVELKKFIDEQF